MLSSVTLYWRITMNVIVRAVVLNCQKCHQFSQGVTNCKGHKSLGPLFDGVLCLKCLCIFLLLVRSCLFITLIKCLKGHKTIGSLLKGSL